jgi:translation initiation factor IF-1
MPAPNPIRTTGTLADPRPDGRTWIAALPNGKLVVAHLPARAPFASSLQKGQRVALELTSYDFSMARIAGPAEDH